MLEYILSNCKSHSQVLMMGWLLRYIRVSRSTFLGSGAYTAHWTGDTVSSWNDLQWSIGVRAVSITTGIRTKLQELPNRCHTCQPRKKTALKFLPKES